MKIAYLSADRGIPVFGNKGASVHVREFVNAVSALGHHVTILTAMRGPMAWCLGAEIIEVGVETLSPPPESAPNGALAHVLAKERQALGISEALRERVGRLAHRDGFDLIYERYSLWSAAGVRAARALEMPCLVEVNAPLLEEQRTYRELVLASEAQAIEAEVFGGADLLLAVSAPLKAYAIARGADSKRTLVLPNGVDTKRFHPAVEAEPLDGVDGKFVVGFVGSLKLWHGLDVLLEAFRALRGRSAAYHLLVVGDGPLRGWVDGYSRGARLDGAVTVTGWIPYDRVPALIQRMDVAVAPYPFLDGFYFSPLKLFEYMAVGRPVVASRIGQIEHVVQDGTTGLLFEPGDPEDLAEKIERLRSDPRLRQALGAAASQQADGHTWEANARRVMVLAGPLVTRR